MAVTIRLKRRAAGGSAGAPTSLFSAEPAFNEQDLTLYYGYGNDGSGNATSVIAIAGSGAFVDKTTAQSIAGQKTFTVSPIQPTPATADNSTTSATTAYVKNQGYITGNQTITISGDASGSGTTSIPLTLATVNSNVGTFTKVTVNAKGLVTAATTLTAADIPTLTASKISDFDTQVRTSRLDQMAAPTASVSYNSQKITSLANGTLSTDAVNKSQLDAVQAYVDSVRTGQDWKDSVRFVPTANDTLSGLAARDGITPVAGDRVGIVNNQTNGVQRGIWIASSGSWTRATDADNLTNTGEVTDGMTFFCEEGPNAGKQYLLTTPNPITLGTTSLNFTVANQGTTYTDGLGIGLSGTTFSVAAGTGLSQDADGLSISATYAGQTSIITLGTISTGVWQGTRVALAYGGTNTDLTTFADGTILKKSGTGIAAAVANTDYLTPNSTLDGGTF